MDEKRKRIFTAGLILGAITIGLAVLFRKTPRDQWGNTLSRVGRDVLGFVKGRYGNNPAIAVMEKTLDRLEDAGGANTPRLT